MQDALEISLSTIGNRPIYYTTDGSQPDTASLIYTEPLIIREDTKLKAVIVTTEDTSSVFEEHIHVNKATFKPSWLANAPHENYTFNGVSTLTDGLQGNQNYNTGRWLGSDHRPTKVDTCLFGIADCQRLKRSSRNGCHRAGSMVF